MFLWYRREKEREKKKSPSSSCTVILQLIVLHKSLNRIGKTSVSVENLYTLLYSICWLCIYQCWFVFVCRHGHCILSPKKKKTNLRPNVNSIFLSIHNFQVPFKRLFVCFFPARCLFQVEKAIKKETISFWNALHKNPLFFSSLKFVHFHCNVGKQWAKREHVAKVKRKSAIESKTYGKLKICHNEKKRKINSGAPFQNLEILCKLILKSDKRMINVLK